MNRLPEFGNLLYKALMNTEFQHHNDGHEVPLPFVAGDWLAIGKEKSPAVRRG
jgi:hypothetical protein